MSIDKFGRSSSKRQKDSHGLKINAKGELDFGGRKIIKVAKPENDADVITKSYVSNIQYNLKRILEEMDEVMNDKMNEKIALLENETTIQIRNVINEEIS